MGNSSRKILFQYDADKAREAVLRLLHRHGGSMDKLKLIKLLFYADRAHLVRYGRPIVGGHYFAMNLGPVSSELKDNIDSTEKDDQLPFKIIGSYNLVAKEPSDENWLSESDLEVLDEIYAEYNHIDSVKLGLMSHNLKAWKNNKPLQGGRKPIPYEDFFEDNEDKTMLEVIMDNQEAMDC